MSNLKYNTGDGNEGESEVGKKIELNAVMILYSISSTFVLIGPGGLLGRVNNDKYELLEADVLLCQ